jgi:hypothetical protein
MFNDRNIVQKEVWLPGREVSGSSRGEHPIERSM